MKTQIKRGDFFNGSEYIWHLVRQDQSQHADFEETKAAIEFGIKSGTNNMDIPEIMKEVEGRMRKDGT